LYSLIKPKLLTGAPGFQKERLESLNKVTLVEAKEKRGAADFFEGGLHKTKEYIY
jgi:hypothetical protein